MPPSRAIMTAMQSTPLIASGTATVRAARVSGRVSTSPRVVSVEKLQHRHRRAQAAGGDVPPAQGVGQ